MGKVTQPIGLYDEESHWYTVDGKPIHQVPLASGEGYRNTTLADARKALATTGKPYLPSVTTITGKWDKGIGLRRWRDNILVKAAKATRRTKTMDERTFLAKCLENAEPELAEGRIFGSAAHNALEHKLLHGDWPGGAKEEHVHAATRALAKLEEVSDGRTERDGIEVVVVNRAYGYAGTCDLRLRRGDWVGYVDWKFKSTKGKPIKVPDEYKMQMPAYAFADGHDLSEGNVSCANIITSRDEPERPSEMFIVNDPNEQNRYLTRFLHLHWVWCDDNDFWPGTRYTEGASK